MADVELPQHVMAALDMVKRAHAKALNARSELAAASHANQQAERDFVEAANELAELVALHGTDSGKGPVTP